MGRCYNQKDDSGGEGGYLTKVHMICLMPSAGMDAPIGGLVTVTPAVSITRKKNTHGGGDEDSDGSEEESQRHCCG